MVEVFVLVLVIILLILVSFSLIFIYKIYTKLDKIHNVVSNNGIDLGKISKLVIGKNSSLSILENKINGIHTAVTTPIVEGLLKNQRLGE